jgi:dodecin
MSSTVLKMIEVVGTSEKGLDDAIQQAVSRASKTVRNMQWFEVTEIRGSIADDEVDQFQVMLKIGFAID